MFYRLFKYCRDIANTHTNLLSFSENIFFFYLLKKTYFCRYCISIILYLTKNKPSMKRIFGLLFLAGIIAISSCGPSAKQRAAEQARLDSIAAVLEEARLDSLEQVRLDSIAAVEAAAAAARRATTAPAPQTQTQPEPTRERRSDTESDTRQRRSEAQEEQEKSEEGTTTRRRRSD
jgi:type II secretory pathway pseudopilin PulG